MKDTTPTRMSDAAAAPHIVRGRSTKIVATLGPASSDPAVIERLFTTGVDVFRLNFSHGNHADHQARCETLRALEAKTGRAVCLMADLQGPKLRIGTFASGPVKLVAGQAFRLDLDLTPGDTARVGMPHPEIFAALRPGTDLLLDDGRVRLRIVACGADFAETRVVSGTALSDRKGVNVPDVALNISALTPKDRADLAFALDLGVDWIALSFVQRPQDLIEARALIGNRAGLLAKIEKPQAVDHLDELVALADGLMVARGDLGVEMPPEEVPSLQKRIVREARRAGKPVIVATQMLESMVTSPAPTRAEASDVATAIFDGADAVMLSAETAAGAYPIEAVTIMDRIATRVERDPLYNQFNDIHAVERSKTASDAMTRAARVVSETLGAAAIVTFTSTGSSTLRAARMRPGVPVLSVTSTAAIARRLMLVYGVQAIVNPGYGTFQDKVAAAGPLAVAAGLATSGDLLVVTAGDNAPGTTNVLRLVTVE
jgi:pyruvate kinase